MMNKNHIKNDFHYVFLPGASGNINFWKPLIQYLLVNDNKQVLSYPGFGDFPESKTIQCFADLQCYVSCQIQKKSILIAQSMGGLFAVHQAFHYPSTVQALVLIATSGGIDLTSFNVQDWRSEYQAQYPTYPDWFIRTKINYESYLNDIDIPILLIWGDCDPISPIKVGQYLNKQFKNASLKIVHGGQHDLAEKHAKYVSQLIQEFLMNL